MTEYEFGEWLKDYDEAFPASAEWRKNLPAREATMRHWYQDTFVNLEKVDCWQVTRLMVKGELTPIEAFKREQTPSIIAAYAAVTRRRRVGAQAEKAFEPEYLADQRGQRFEVLGVAKQILNSIAGGCTPTEACEIHLPPVDPDEAPRYRCLLCKDTGWCNVWHVTAMHAARTDSFDRRRHTTMATMACNCPAGDKYPAFRKFDPNRFIACSNYTDEREIERLHERMANWGVRTSDWDAWQPDPQTQMFSSHD